MLQIRSMLAVNLYCICARKPRHRNTPNVERSRSMKRSLTPRSYAPHGLAVFVCWSSPSAHLPRFQSGNIYGHGRGRKMEPAPWRHRHPVRSVGASSDQRSSDAQGAYPFPQPVSRQLYGPRAELAGYGTAVRPGSGQCRLECRTSRSPSTRRWRRRSPSPRRRRCSTTARPAPAPPSQGGARADPDLARPLDGAAAGSGVSPTA